MVCFFRVENGAGRHPPPVSTVRDQQQLLFAVGRQGDHDLFILRALQELQADARNLAGRVTQATTAVRKQDHLLPGMDAEHGHRPSDVTSNSLCASLTARQRATANTFSRERKWCS